MKSLRQDLKSDYARCVFSRNKVMLRLTKDYIITGFLSFPEVYEIVVGLIEGRIP